VYKAHKHHTTHTQQTTNAQTHKQPTRFGSYLWGAVHRIELPIFMRAPLYKTYSVAFGCLLDEVDADLASFPNLNAFFKRRLVAGARPIADAALVSPVDGYIMSCGRVNTSGGGGGGGGVARGTDGGGTMLQIKNMPYSVSSLLGFDPTQRNMPVPGAYGMQRPPRAEWLAGGATTAERFSLSSGPRAFSPTPAAAPASPSLPSSPPTTVSSSSSSSSSSSWWSWLSWPSSSASSSVSSPPLGGDLYAHADGASKRARNLYYAVLYLAPGDYHRIHSPAEMTVDRYIHIAGELQSVRSAASALY
jgi:phosphatidylserine decarboxylase